MGPNETNKTAWIVARMHPEDKEEIKAAARRDRMKLSEWVRGLLVAAARERLQHEAKG